MKIGIDKFPKRVDKIQQKPTVYTLAPYVAEGILTVVSGQESIGKSILVCAKLAADNSRGINPFTGEAITPVSSIVYSLEDKDRVTAQRYIDFGGVVDKTGKRPCGHFYDSDDNRTLSNLDDVIKDIETIKPVHGLVVIDSLSAFLSTLSVKAIELAFTRLQSAVESVPCALLVLHHPNTFVTHVSKWAAGSSRIRRFIRNGFFVAEFPPRDEHEDVNSSQRIWIPAKWQYGPKPISQLFNVFKGDDGLLKCEMDVQYEISLKQYVTLLNTKGKSEVPQCYGEDGDGEEHSPKRMKISQYKCPINTCNATREVDDFGDEADSAPELQPKAKPTTTIKNVTPKPALPPAAVEKPDKLSRGQRRRRNKKLLKEGQAALPTNNRL
jgi:hypothetical protein